MPSMTAVGISALDLPSGADEGANRVGEVGRAVELDHVGAALLDQPDGGLDGALDALLERPEREVAARERALDAAAHRLADDQHLVHCDFERIGMAPQID